VTEAVSSAAFVPQADSSDLATAMANCEFPLVVWRAPGGEGSLMNRAGSELIGLPLEEILGRSLIDFVLPHDAAAQVVHQLISGAVDGIRSIRTLIRGDGETIPIQSWSRVIEVDGRRGGVSLFMSEGELGHLGRDPAQPWRDLVPVAVGRMDGDWHVTEVSNDIASVLGGRPEHYIGVSVIDLVHPEDRPRILADRLEDPTRARSRCHIRLRKLGGDYTDTCIMMAPSREGLYGFAVVGPPVLLSERAAQDRVAELEARLRRIAAEVRAAGLVDATSPMPDDIEHPQIDGLSTRQWEILGLLLQGQRVPTIASALFLSQSTVRNHLTAIFRKFGVHSQAELIALLRPATAAAP